jgi:hypothetical protein
VRRASCGTKQRMDSEYSFAGGSLGIEWMKSVCIHEPFRLLGGYPAW